MRFVIVTLISCLLCSTYSALPLKKSVFAKFLDNYKRNACHGVVCSEGKVCVVKHNHVGYCYPEWYAILLDEENGRRDEIEDASKASKEDKIGKEITNILNNLDMEEVLELKSFSRERTSDK
ncbi:uncharacterized protein LOC102807937 [Saccoglossus kowalevskii]|uniref:Uncharacterized protein LOC102807937 n=1 Tax=Saccoglossus kowalevskii TaxID=10224 RepID=A0ABM0MDG7_SACKO|nr:PREDICTED: uncharacterized protein LOC102807937 [Saccoglossus kowalevskii]